MLPAFIATEEAIEVSVRLLERVKNLVANHWSCRS